MNATPLVLQPSAANQAAQSSQTNAADEGGKSVAAGTTFAGALQDAASKPAPAPEAKTGAASDGKPRSDPKTTRKTASAKAAKDAPPGDTLPAAGNLPPPSTPPPALPSASAAVDAAGTITTASPVAPGTVNSADAPPNGGPGSLPESSANASAATTPGAAGSPDSPALPAVAAVGTPDTSASPAAAVTTTAAVAMKPSAAVAAQPSVKAAAGSAASKLEAAPTVGDPTNATAPGSVSTAPASAAAAGLGQATDPTTGTASSSDPAVTAAALSGLVPQSGTAKPAFAGAPDGDSDGAPGVSGVSGAAGAGAAGAAATPASLEAAAIARSVTALADPAGADKHSHDDAQDPAAGGSGDNAAALSQLGATQTSAAPDATPMPTLRVHANVDSAEFAQSLSDRVSYMVGNGLNGAKLQVNPPQLGPIEVRIAVQGDHAQVWMTAHSMVTRDALEASSPKLHEMLGNQGFGQVSVDISQRSFQERSAFSQPYERAAATGRAAAAPTTVTAVSAARVSASALDAYA